MTLLANYGFMETLAWQKSLGGNLSTSQQDARFEGAVREELIPLLMDLLETSPAVPVLRELAGRKSVTTAEVNVAIAGLVRQLDWFVVYAYYTYVMDRSSAFRGKLVNHKGHLLRHSLDSYGVHLGIPEWESELTKALRRRCSSTSFIATGIAAAVSSYNSR